MPFNKVIKSTSGISVSVETKFREHLSNPEQNYFFFSYFINIQNETAQPIRLMYRKWEITDSNGEYREVEGEGVVGLQPEIAPGQSFQYESGCNFTTDLGRMSGTYIMQRVLDKINIPVEIPEFIMVVPWKLN